jgi:hypothetical protein
VAREAALSDEARADRRVVLTAIGIMFALVLSGVAFAQFFATTSCRQLGPALSVAPITPEAGLAARMLLAEAGPGDAGVAAAEALLGPVASAVRLPFSAPLRIGEAPIGVGAVVVTGDGAAVVSAAGAVTSAATFRRAVTVVGDGVSLFALVVGNTLTGQVDAIRPLVPTVDGFAPGACVDTSAVGSPLSFLHDARGGNLVGLRTDEDGTDAVLELRDHVRGRVWAPVIELPRAPAGLQGSRTSGALGPDMVVVARRTVLGADEPEPVVLGFRRTDGAERWAIDAATLRAALPGALASEPALRVEVAHVDAARVLVVAFPDVAPEARLPLPTFGPLGALAPAHERSVTLTLDLSDGSVVGTAPGPAPVGREGPEREALLAELVAAGVGPDDALVTDAGTWILVGDVLARLGG